MTTIDWVLLALPPCASIGWCCGTAVLAVLQPLTRRPRNDLLEFPGISLLVPVASPAPGLRLCVSSVRAMDYPDLEVLLLAAAEDPGAVQAVECEARARLGFARAVILAPRESPNPKVGLLAAAIDRAGNDILLFTDDNAVSPPSRAQSHLARLNEGCMLVSAAVVGVKPEGFWGHVDAAFMNGYFARLQLAGDRVGLSGVSGKSMMVRRTDVERSGGLLQTGQSLCEDSALQKRIARIGGRIGLSREPMGQVVGHRTPVEVWQRHKRWFFCRWSQVPAVFVAEALFSTIAASFFGALTATAAGNPWWIGALAVSLTLLGVEMAFLSITRWRIGRWYPLVWLVRELLVLPLCVAALAGGTVKWRNRRLSLGG